MTLAEFYAARLDEDEAAARLALEQLRWLLDQDVRPPVSPGDAEHIVTTSGRTLREVEAKRAILAIHTLTTTHEPTATSPNFADVICAVCGWASDTEGSACYTLRAIAAVWSDHADYRQEWATP